MFELEIKANIFNNKIKLACYSKLLENINDNTDVIGIIPIGDEFSESFWIYVSKFYDGTKSKLISMDEDKKHRNIFEEDKDMSFEAWVHKTDKFIFEFPDEETALYFKLKFCPD